MDRNTQFLNYIYQNSQMGITTIEQLTTKVEDSAFHNQLYKQLQEYKAINQEAVNQLHKSGQTEKDIPKTQEASAYMSIAIKTLVNHSPSHISEMMIKGSAMGIIDVTKNLKEYQDAPQEIKNLADRLLKTEENNIQSLKTYL